MSVQTSSHETVSPDFPALSRPHFERGGPVPTVLEGIARFDKPLKLQSGRMLENPSLAWRRIGDRRLPVILVMGGISAGRQVWGRGARGRTGWWQSQVGPGKAIDTRRFGVLAFDYLAGCGESTSPAASRQGIDDFPAIDTLDQATAATLLLDHLGISRLASVIGASYGGMVALQMAARYPHRLERSLVVCAAHGPAPLASGLRHVQREILRFGQKHHNKEEAVRIARALAMCSYRSEQEFFDRFTSGSEGVKDAAAYIDHCGRIFSETFDLHSYLCLSQSIDDHQVDPHEIHVAVDLLGFGSDQIVPPRQLDDLRAQLGGAGFLRLVDSQYGHDAFLKEPVEVAVTIRAHLETGFTGAKS